MSSGPLWTRSTAVFNGKMSGGQGKSRIAGRGADARDSKIHGDSAPNAEIDDLQTLLAVRSPRI